MKKVIFFFFLTITAFGHGCSIIPVTVRATGSLADVANAITGNWVSVLIMNEENLYVRVYVLYRPFVVPPGGGIHDSWVVEFDHSEIPIVLNFYTDPGCKNLVGFWMDRIFVRRNEQSVYAANRMILLKGGQLSLCKIPARSVAFEIKEVDMPRIIDGSSSIIEIMNGTSSDIVVRSMTKLVGFSNVFKKNFWKPFARSEVLEPGEFILMSFEGASQPYKVSYAVSFLERGGNEHFIPPVDFYIGYNYNSPGVFQRCIQ